MSREISGVLAAVPTPFDADSQFDEDLFLEQCEWVLAQGCDGLNVLGTTGEANSQGRRERARVMRTAAASLLRTSPLMVGTGTPALQETIELTRLAAELKYDAALLLPPYYYKGVSDDGLLQYFDAVIRDIDTAEIGIYLYNFPQMTGLEFSIPFIERLLARHPKHLRGMKDSSGKTDYTNAVAAHFGDAFDVFPGSEGPLPDAAKFNYAGCISASVNATAARAARVWRHRDAVTDAEIAELRDLRERIASVPMVAAVKTLVAARTGKRGWLRWLPPLTEPDAAASAVIEAVAVELGFRKPQAGVA